MKRLSNGYRLFLISNIKFYDIPQSYFLDIQLYFYFQRYIFRFESTPHLLKHLAYAFFDLSLVLSIWKFHIALHHNTKVLYWDISALFYQLSIVLLDPYLHYNKSLHSNLPIYLIEDRLNNLIVHSYILSQFF